MYEKGRVVFFGSGDFPIATFKSLMVSDNCEVVGLVTSKDKPVFGNERLIDIAKENGIPFYIPENLTDAEFLNWLDELNADIFCVISYKFLPKEVIDKCKGVAFNVHASLLPYLRGAAPINWAIRLGFKETGLTVFKLNDKIDCGAIIHSSSMKIDENETFGSLYGKLTDYCDLITDNIIGNLLNGKLTANVTQGSIPSEFAKLPVFHAPKLNIENTTMRFNENEKPSTITVDRMIRSLSPNIGTTFNMEIRDHDTIVKKLTFKVYDASIKKDKNNQFDNNDIITDWKNYLYLSFSLSDNDVISIRKIQLPGKKILDIKEFLKGFQNFRNPSYTYKLC